MDKETEIKQLGEKIEELGRKWVVLDKAVILMTEYRDEIGRQLDRCRDERDNYDLYHKNDGKSV